WRLGGKCASGRDAANHDRIEEHGFHVWFGFYENAFRTIRRVYQQVAQLTVPERTFPDWTAAFARHSAWTLEQRLPGCPPHWPVLFPVNDGIPGEGRRDFRQAVFQNLRGWLRTGARVAVQRPDGSWLGRKVALALRLAGLGVTMVSTAATRILDDLAALAV